MNRQECIADRNKEYDVIVAGGGTAGWVAALAAARMGKKVLLLERKGYLGGVLATSLPILGFHDAKQHQVVKGYAAEFVDRLKKYKGSEGYHLTDLWHSSMVTVNGTVAKQVIFEMLKEAGVEIALFSQVVAIVKENNKITGVAVQNKTSRNTFFGKTMVDATGDAAVAYLAGASFGSSPENLQPPSLVFRLENVDMEKLTGYLVEHPSEFVNWRMKPGRDITREFLQSAQLFLTFPGLIPKIKHDGNYLPVVDRVMFIRIPYSKSVVVNMLRSREIDGTCSDSLSRATAEQYLYLNKLWEFFKENVPGFEASYLSDADPEIQLRETRRIAGDYVLNADDIFAGRSFEDNIALGGYFIDVHNSADAHCSCTLVENGYGIPYRTLLPGGLEGLLVAGRCISGTKEASGSYRVMATCMATGQAAGTAAALCAEKAINPRELDIGLLQKALQAQGMVLFKDPSW